MWLTEYIPFSGIPYSRGEIGQNQGMMWLGGNLGLA